MKQKLESLCIETRGPGLYAFTRAAQHFARETAIQNGLLICFIRHTSASLLIQENADSDVLADLEDFMRRLVSRDSRLYRHNAEGPDDMPSHIRAALSYPWLIAKEFPKAQIMIGGGAFTAFADQLILKLPEGTIGILGEGEDAILKVIEGQSLEKERYIIREGKGRLTIVAIPPPKTKRTYKATPALERKLSEAKGAKELDCPPDFFTERLDD